MYPNLPGFKIKIIEPTLPNLKIKKIDQPSPVCTMIATNKARKSSQADLINIILITLQDCRLKHFRNICFFIFKFTNLIDGVKADPREVFK